MEIHTSQTDNGALLSHAIKWQRSQGLCCGCKIYCGGWDGGVCGNVISMLRQELRQDLHGHETPPTFLGSPAFVCMSYTFVSRGDSFCQSFKSSECKKRKKKSIEVVGCYFRTFPTCRGAFRGDDCLVTSCKWQNAAHCCGSVRAATHTIPATMSFGFKSGAYSSRARSGWDNSSNSVKACFVYEREGRWDPLPLCSVPRPAGTWPEQETRSLRAEN